MSAVRVCVNIRVCVCVKLHECDDLWMCSFVSEASRKPVTKSAAQKDHPPCFLARMCNENSPGKEIECQLKVRGRP